LQRVRDSETIVFCRATQQSFLRLLTTASTFIPYREPPLTNDAAWDTFEAWLTDPRVSARWDEPPGLDDRWLQYSQRHTASAKLWMDAYLAAFAQTGGYQMVTTDAGFKQFGGLDLVLLGEDSPA
jgi:toxin-antitoxin system PIN domain toxin